jgi:ATP adenylyltransferase
MKNLWTPWRMAYIQGSESKSAGCIFDAALELPYDKDGLLLYRDRQTVVLLNRFPYANGHLLVAPARHVRDLLDLEREEASALMERIRESVAILRRHVKPQGFNIGLNLESIAGAGLAEHLHFHIVPRWDGDHNFMTIVAGTRTVPEFLADTFDRLLPDFQASLLPAGAKSSSL